MSHVDFLTCFSCNRLVSGNGGLDRALACCAGSPGLITTIVKGKISISNIQMAFTPSHRMVIIEIIGISLVLIIIEQIFP